MRLPNAKDYHSEYHVNDETYTLRFVSRIPGGKAGDIGLCDAGKKAIFIKKGLTKMQTFRTLTHELLHAIEFEYELKIPHSLVYQLEKSIVDTLLYNFLEKGGA